MQKDESQDGGPKVITTHIKRDVTLIFFAILILAAVTVIIQELRKVSYPYQSSSYEPFEYKITGR